MVYQTRELSRRERETEKRRESGEKKEVSIVQFILRCIFIPLEEVNWWKTVHLFFTQLAFHSAYI